MRRQDAHRSIVSMRRKLPPLLLTVAFLIPVGPAAFQGQQDSVPASQRGGTWTPLAPAPDSDLVLDSVRVLIGADGTITIEGSGGPIEGMPIFAYDISVDIRRGTYRAEIVPLSDVRVYPSRQSTSGSNRASGQDAWAFPSSIQPLAIAPGTYEAKILVQTLDRIFIVLAQTTDYLKWTVSSSGGVQWRSYTDGCAAFTTPLGTHWYVSWCSSSAPYYRSGVAYNDASGSYNNWDWGDPNMATTSSHWITVGGKNDGHCTYSWSYSDSGEDAGLIWGRRVVVQCP